MYKKIPLFLLIITFATSLTTGCSNIIEWIFDSPQYEQPKDISYLIEKQLKEANITSLEQKSNLLHNANIDQIRNYLITGKLTCVEVTAYYLKRIQILNKKMHIVISVNPEAITEAKKLDEQGPPSKNTSLLYGIPILVKDNIETKDKMPTTGGTIALKDNYAKKDANVIQHLRANGAIILAKANLSELAGLSFIYPIEPSGFSALGGQTLNPYGPGTLNVSGSSSGSAAGVAADLAPAAIGTETYGSIIGPASANSVIGVKPTLGRLSQSGIIPLSHTYDTAGPLTKTVKDAALLLSLMEGYQPDEPSTHHLNYFTSLNPHRLKGAKLAATKDFNSSTIGRKIIASLKAAGASVDLISYHIPEADLKNSFKKIIAYEFRQDFSNYLKESQPFFGVNSLSDLISFNNENPKERIPYGQNHLIYAENLKLTEKESKQKIATLNKITKQYIVSPFFQDKNYDAILTINLKANLSKYGTLPSDISAYASLPTVCIPVGYLRGNIPVSITFIGPKNTEQKLLSLAYSFEQANPKRIPPKIK
ncbi:amidase family protein [Thermoflavimicrobium daqui]|nr:amidase family protein [Thermoflavimicrobium daqui]